MTTSIDSSAELDRIVEQVDFVHTGPGTLAGRYLRRYWQPIYVSAKLAKGRIVPIRILGEDLALYRSDSGTARVISNECPHRLTRLSTGWVEGETIRCRYHGWRYDESGHCVEQPAEPNPFCAKVRKLASYPTHEAHGLIFAYFGDGETPAFRPLPGLEDGAREGWTVCPSVEMIPCNWFQSAENIMDDVHVNFSHRDHLVNTAARPYVPTKTWAQETAFGMTQFQERGGHTDQIHFIMPNQCFLAHQLRSGRDNKPFWFKALFWYVPIDDESHLHVLIMIYHTKRRERPDGTPVHEEIEAILSGRKSWEDIADHPNIIRIQDGVSICGQGKIEDRSREHLGRSDAAVVMLRRLWRRELELLAAGKPVTPFGTPEPQALRQEERDAMGVNAWLRSHSLIYPQNARSTSPTPQRISSFRVRGVKVWDPEVALERLMGGLADKRLRFESPNHALSRKRPEHGRFHGPSLGPRLLRVENGGTTRAKMGTSGR